MHWDPSGFPTQSASVEQSVKLLQMSVPPPVDPVDPEVEPVVDPHDPVVALVDPVDPVVDPEDPDMMAAICSRTASRSASGSVHPCTAKITSPPETATENSLPPSREFMGSMSSTSG
jgi:hypothetical protein